MPELDPEKPDERLSDETDDDDDPAPPSQCPAPADIFRCRQEGLPGDT